MVQEPKGFGPAFAPRAEGVRVANSLMLIERGCSNSLMQVKGAVLVALEVSGARHGVRVT
jgi:hypothetical protein